MRITPGYLALNVAAHIAMPDYGRGGSKWAGEVRVLAERIAAATVLDYGCGKGLLTQSLPDLRVAEYDPAIPGKDGNPEPADIVVCTDVLEHIEPDCLDHVLAHLAHLARCALLVNVSLVVGRRRLPNGSPAHCLVRPGDWWQSRLAHLGQWEPVKTRADAWAGICIR